jgi:hypothetical protein
MNLIYSRGTPRSDGDARHAAPRFQSAMAGVVILAICGVQPQPCWALTTIVGDGGNLVAAVAAAPNGSIIEIQSNQTFVGSLRWGGKFLTIQAGSGFQPTVKGSPYDPNTPFNPLGRPAVFGVVGSLGTGGLLRGLRLEYGDNAPMLPSPYNNFGPYDFSAVSISATGTTWSDLTFENDVFAGGVGLSGTGDFIAELTTRDSHFLGGMRVGGTGDHHSHVQLERNVFDGVASIDGTGRWQTNVEMRDNGLSYMSVGGTGEAARANVTMENNSLRALSIGGTGSMQADVTMLSNLLSPDAGQAGISMSGTGDFVGRVTAVDNVLEGSGGTGISMSGISDSSFSGRFVNNTVVGFKQGINVGSNSAASFENMLLVNGDDIGSFANSTIANSLIADSTFAGTNGNFAGMPLLGPMHELLAGSIGIDAGNNLAANLPAFDIAGNPRILDGNGDGIARVDVGAFEYVVPEPATIGISILGLLFVTVVRRRGAAASRD